MKVSRNLLFYATIILTAVLTGFTLHVIRHFLYPVEAHSVSERTAIPSATTAEQSKQGKNRFEIRTKPKTTKQKAPPVANIINTTTAAKYLIKRSLPWSAFLSRRQQQGGSSSVSKSKQALYQLDYGLITCPSSVVDALSKPSLQQADVDWCKWATSKTGGAVVVGKSWGNLAKADERARFDSLNCNAVSARGNPSCDDAWGDSHVRNWKKHRDPNVQCTHPDTKSNMECFVNDNNDRFCVLENVMIDFSKAQKVDKGRNFIASKKFQQDFMSLDCRDGEKEPGFTFPHLLSPSRSVSSRDTCDYVIDDTVLLFSHDNVRNMAHTMNDVMNVWLMLWLDGKAGNVSQIPLLSIDALKMYNNFDDAVNQYFTTYVRNFATILRGTDYGPTGTLCLRRVLTQPLPARGFVWENWHKDLPCTFVGPSSLYQRWNLHVRSSFGLLTKAAHDQFMRKPLKVVLIMRTESKNDWGSYRTSRLIENEDDVLDALWSLQETLTGEQAIELVVQDFSLLTFEEQMRLMSETSVLVGMHGAGISQSQYMSIGTARCCGVLEIFPKGEFSPVRGFANMIRKMGLSYSRIDISAADSLPEGAKIPVKEMTEKLSGLIAKVVRAPACVLPQVISDPYLSL